MGTSATLVMLAVFSGLSMNLILQFGLSPKGMAFESSYRRERLLAGSAILFITVMLLWLVLSFARSVIFLGLVEYIVLFPASCLVFSILEYLTNRFIIKDAGQPETAPGYAIFNSALAGAALFITLNVAGGFWEALVLSLCFSGGAALVFVIVYEIRRRSEMEAVPLPLRGGSLALIAMGLLSLVFSSCALMLYEVLGAR